MKQEKMASSRTEKYGNIVVVTNFRSGFKIHLKKLGSFTHTVLKNLKFKQIVLSLIFVSDSAIKRLNQKYLNHSWVTDVLAFPFSGTIGEKLALKNRSFLGEIIISPKRAKVYAKRFHIPFQEELVRYVCHGILHLQGYSDHSHHAKIKMRRTEDKLLKLSAAKDKGIV